MRLLTSILVSLLSGPALAAGDPSPGEAAGKPNVVVIFIDDLGYGDIGSFGSKLNRTPHLDRMADEGMRLTSFYAAPVCSVSRAQLLTGCYGPRISVPGVFFPAGAKGLHPDEVTIPEVMKPAGYATVCIGKWHVGDQPEFLPTSQGFDHYFGIPYSNDMQLVSTETGERVVPLLRDDQVAELLTNEQQTRVTERYTEEAVKFIRDHRDEPFFLYFPHTAVHTPIVPGAAFAGKSANGRYGDWVEEVDWSVGEVLDTLRELELEQQTLVIFTSDNGPWLIKGPDGGTALPLRGGKGATWEGGVRVPTVAWWPGTIEAGSVRDTPAGTIDLLPTFAELSGGTVPQDRVIDGRSIAALLKGETTDPSREAHYYFGGTQLQAVRRGPWKLAVLPQRETMGKDKVLSPDVGDAPRLYNLEQEVGERTDLSAEHPEIVAELQALVEAKRLEIAENQRPAGSVENPVTLYPAVPRKTKTPRKPSPVSLATLKIGDSVPPQSAPDVAGKAFTILCTLETEDSEGVILSHGGSSVGYALYLQDGKVVFAVRHGSRIQRMRSGKVGPMPVQIEASLAKNGTISLKAGKAKPVKGKSEGVLNRQPAEDFNLGFDARNTVDHYDGSGKLTGSITDLVID